MWDDETILKLIEKYAKKRILWDTSIKDNKNKHKKNDAWEEISKHLGIPQRDVEIKMHILRSQFARERKKISSSIITGRAADIVKSKWKFFDALKFLLGDSTTTMCENSDTTYETVKVEDLQQEDLLDESEEPSEPATTTPSIAISSPSRSPSPSPLPSTSGQKTTKRKSNDTDYHNEIYHIVESKRKLDDAKDEFDFYGQYVASELRTEKNGTAVLMAKSYINNILIDMRMGKYNSSSKVSKSSRMK